MGESERILVARCGRKHFGLPLAEVLEIFELAQPAVPVPGAPAWVAGMVNHHGQAVLLVEAGSLLGEAGSSGRQAVLLRLAGDQVGLVVEGVEAVRERSEAVPAEGEAPALQLLCAASLQRAMEERLSETESQHPGGDFG